MRRRRPSVVLRLWRGDGACCNDENSGDCETSKIREHWALHASLGRARPRVPRTGGFSVADCGAEAPFRQRRAYGAPWVTATNLTGCFRSRNGDRGGMRYRFATAQQHLRQAAGNCAIVIGGFGFGGVFGGFGCSTASQNQQSRSRPQPSPRAGVLLALAVGTARRAAHADVEVIVVAPHRTHLAQPGAVARLRGTAPS